MGEGQFQHSPISGMMKMSGTLLSTVTTLTLMVSMAGASSWNYGIKSPGDPNHWGSIKGSEKCGTGRRQSPVDISRYRTKQLPDLEFHNYDDLFNDVELVNNGHSLQLDKKHKKHQISISGGGLDGRYYFEQLHFHWGDNSAIGSEHTIHGRRFPLEMHLVHFSSEYSNVLEASTKPGGLVVLSVLFQIAAPPSTWPSSPSTPCCPGTGGATTGTRAPSPRPPAARPSPGSSSTTSPPSPRRRCSSSDCWRLRSPASSLESWPITSDHSWSFTGDTSTSSPTLAAMMTLVMRTLSGAAPRWRSRKCLTTESSSASRRPSSPSRALEMAMG